MIVSKKPSLLSVLGAFQLLLAGWSGHQIWLHWSAWENGDRFAFGVMTLVLIGQGLWWTVFRAVEPDPNPLPSA